jgi:hypothetical protein
MNRHKRKRSIGMSSEGFLSKVAVTTSGISADPRGIAKRHVLRCIGATMVCLIMMGAGFTQRVFADQWDKKTIVTFSAPVEIPGKALPAGTYVFKLLDSSSNRNIVQVWDKDEKHLLATILAVPDYRLKPADKPVIRFEERPSGTPEAIKAWFYPGDEYGQQFVYPHDRAVELAKRTNQHVLSMPNDMAKNITTQAKSASDASIQEMQKTEVTGVNPSGQAVELHVVILEKPEN